MRPHDNLAAGSASKKIRLANGREFHTLPFLKLTTSLPSVATQSRIASRSRRHTPRSMSSSCGTNPAAQRSGWWSRQEQRPLALVPKRADQRPTN